MTPCGNISIIVFGVLSCLLYGRSVVAEQQRTQSLDAKWSLSNSDGSVSLPAQVPGCVHSALQQQRVIQDPYFRFNDVSYRWIAFDNWTYTTTFTVSTHLRGKQKVLLFFDGVDTVASVWLNGVFVGKMDNMFRGYDFSVRDLLKDEDNVLKVHLLSPVVYASEQRKAHSAYSIPPECPPDVQKGECHVNFIRKEQCSFSWDWGPSFPTMGLWKEVRLEAFDTLKLIQVSSVSLYNDSLSQWRVHVDLVVDAVQTTNCQITLSIPELDSEQVFQAQFFPERSKNTFVLQINTGVQVKLWWPNGHGDQPFYHMTVKGFQDGLSILTTESKVYFRTVELVQEPIVGSPGLSFYFRINRKPVFLKGSNWIPAHSFQDQVTPAVLKNLLQSAVDANMNALRVWGGGVYEQDLFYSICDELGIMVWQDFMFACAMYPAEDDFIQTVREEVIQQVQRLKSHPSVIIWSGNNENEAALATDWFNIPASQRPIYINDYVKLYVNNIREIVQDADQSRPFLVSSPTNGAESQREGWVAADPYDPHYGDTHFYSYVLDCWDWRTFPRTRFASEYGFQSWPSFSTLQPVSIKEDWSYDSNFTSHRQHHQAGNPQMLLQAAFHFHLPNSTDPLKRFKDTLYITQVAQAQCVKTQTEFYRRSRSEIVDGEGHTMGALYWQLNDIWQAPSWSSIEFGGKWKMLHYFAQNFFASVLPVGFEDNDTLFIYAVSDLNRDVKLRTVVTVYTWTDLDPVCTLRSGLILVPGGTAVAIFKQPVSTVLAGCGRCTRLTCLLTFHLEDPGSVQQGPTNHHFLCSPKDAQGLKRPNITAKVQEDKTGFSITLHSDCVAPFVWLDVGNIPGRFSSNGFLMVSRNVTVTFIPDQLLPLGGTGPLNSPGTFWAERDTLWTVLINQSTSGGTAAPRDLHPSHHKPGFLLGLCHGSDSGLREAPEERRAESIAEENPLGKRECPSVEQILSHFGFSNVTQLTVDHLGRICPAVLTQVLLPSCPYAAPEDLPPLDYSVWGYGFLAVTVINLAALLGLLLIPFTKKPYFPKVLTYFIGLAIGTLFSNAVLQLIPEALGFDPKADNYVKNAVGIFGGFYALFFIEKVLKMALRVENEHGHSHFIPAEAPQENVVHNGDIPGKNNSIVLTNITTIATDRSSPERPHSVASLSQDVHTSGVMCHWLRGQQITSIKTVAWMISLSDALHNFIDGLAIGASFTVSVLAGFSTSTAIVCEEFPHELGDFVILLNAGMSVPQAIFFNLLSAVSCYIGLVLGILVGSNFAPNAIFAIAGGMFLYISLADMFPEMESIAREQRRTSDKIVFFLIQNAGLFTGFTVILLITIFAGDINLG
ncbi:hypothetical protein Q5P01_020915 [Channa striata]|uniref:Beta-mannosidase n=1 Tax=Channa striata TaxID=64152 RepID=A0AA88LYI0_CHASR|nr:hypothetical protein Q5P01_020915 [Channa striata]